MGLRDDLISAHPSCCTSTSRLLTLGRVASGVGVEIAEEFARLKDEQAAHDAVVHAAMMHPAVLKPFLVLGRLVRIQEGSTDWRWGVVLQCSFKPAADAEVRPARVRHAFVNVPDLLRLPAAPWL